MTRPDTRHYDQRRGREIAEGTWLRPLPLHEVRPYVVELVKRHRMTQAAIARAAGIGKDTVGKIMRRERTFVQGAVAARLLAVEPAPTPPAGLVDITGARRMSQALAVIGYSINWQITRSGVPRATLVAVRGDRVTCRGNIQRWVGVDTDAAISAMYDRAPMKSAEQNSCAAAWAKRKGWVGPMAWDDDTIRDPRARPFSGAVSRRTHVLDSNIDDAIAGRIGYDDLTTAERVIVVARLSGQGWSAERIGEWLVWGDTDYHCRVNVTKFMSRHEIPPAPRAALLFETEYRRQVKKYTAAAA